MNKWYDVLKETMQLSVLTKTLPTKGNLDYEYNPLRNYRLTKDMYEYNDRLWTESQLKTEFGIEWQKATNTSDPSYDEKTSGKWINSTTKEDWPENDYPITRLKGELVDFVTDELNFDLSHPVTITPQLAYDNTVNLILNDGINQPRLINTRFTATGKDTYQIIDRSGDNDTNIYDQGEQFDIDTSLYKRTSNIPKLTLLKVTAGGQLKCGNYHFYFKLADADGNETDFVAESGLVSLFVGSGDPCAIYTGNKNENTAKLVQFELSNVDPSYNYVSVYYSRATAEDGTNKSIEVQQIDRLYTVNNVHVAKITIDGSEFTITKTESDINLAFDVVDYANCAVTAQNRLFLGNVHKPTVPIKELTDLSLRFLPYLYEKPYELNIDEEYNISSTVKGYYDPMFIYNYVGYWDQELYRLGIVYMLANNELTPVFNIRGRLKLKTFQGYGTSELFTGNKINDGQYCEYYLQNKLKEDVTINSNEFSNLIEKPADEEGYFDDSYRNSNENVKGVVSFDSDSETNTIHAFEIRVSDEVIAKLKALGVKCFFFVRQGRIPLTLCQGITIGLDKVGRVPTIPTTGGVLDDLSEELGDTTYVETKDIKSTNYISEGFLQRFSFELKRKSSSIWATIGTVVATVAAVAVMAAATVVTCGGAAIAAAAVAVVMSTAAMTAATISAIFVAGVAILAAAATATVMATVATTEELAYAIERAAANVELKGRATEIPSGYYRSEIDESRQLGKDFKERIIIKDYTKNTVGGIICPDYDVAPQTYGQYFTGNEIALRTSKSQPLLQKFIDYYKDDQAIKVGYAFTNDDRHFYMNMSAYANTSTVTSTSRVVAVDDGVACVTIGSKKFRGKAGNADEAWRYECIGTDYQSELTSSSDDDDDDDNDDTPSYKETNSDIVRGIYGPYLGMDSYSGVVGQMVSLMIPGYQSGLMSEYVQMRIDDVSSYYAISDRIDLANLNEYYLGHTNLVNDVSNDENCKFTVYRGDCYICQFTHRVIRNFNDPSAPYNDVIVDSTSWKKNYKVDDSGKFENINLGDVNAVKLGMWVTFTVRSNKNLNIRSLDSSSIDEVAKMGHPYSFYPYGDMSAEGSYKSKEALVYNDGFTQNVSQRIYKTTKDVPYSSELDRNKYGTRIMYSSVYTRLGSYANGYRTFTSGSHQDYTNEYGDIVKLINYNDSLFVVFEHGLALIEINERVLVSDSQNGSVYAKSETVLPESLSSKNIISESYGSIWADSVISVPDPTGNSRNSAIFGVDTVAKKIWKFSGGTLQIISDFTVQEFLNTNITFTQRENTPILGIRNVKTAYNAFKQDIMFTFYDDLNTTSEKVWNLCYNLLQQRFTTFYSWVPSFMENINNMPFSFDRNVSKWIAKLGQSHAENSFAEGIVLSHNIYNNDGSASSLPKITYKYLTTTGSYRTDTFVLSAAPVGYIGTFNLVETVLPEGENVQYYVKFELLRDIYGYYKNFEIRQDAHIPYTQMKNPKYKINIPLYHLYFKPQGQTIGSLINSDYIEPVYDSDGNEAVTFSKSKNYYFTELYYRNYAGHSYADYDDYKVTVKELDSKHCTIPSKYNNYDGDITLTLDNYFDVVQKMNLPIFNDRTGARVTLSTPIKKQNLVQILNIKATIYARYTSPEESLEEATLAEYMNYLKSKSAGTAEDAESMQGWLEAGTYSSSIAITSNWNYNLLQTDFWKHGQAGNIDVCDPIKPTKWYGEQHPFEFECLVQESPGIQKIFQNLEIVSNKAKPESFHFEIIGESYDFAKDKVNMYFRQEARKALFQYNGADIEYNSNFIKTNPKQQPKSAELIHYYYDRQDTLEDIYDTYVGDAVNGDKYTNINSYRYGYNSWAALTPNKDYRHLSGAEIVYYPNRQEYRIWQHQPAIDIDDLSQDTATSIIRANCHYLEDRWRVSINPILICYKNEYKRKIPGALCQPENSTWPNAMNQDKSKATTKLPPITIQNTSIPDAIKKAGEVNFPTDINSTADTENALYKLYYLGTDAESPIDGTNWLNDLSVYKASFGDGQNRKEIDLRDKFIKVRIRYSGEELAVIQLLKTIYTISYA